MAGTWWCQKCKEAVISQRVTFQECHDTCGHPVEWVEYHVTLQEELTQAKDLIARMAKHLKAERCNWSCIVYANKPRVSCDGCKTHKMLAEAEAMTAESSETVTSAAVTIGECQAEWMADPD